MERGERKGERRERVFWVFWVLVVVITVVVGVGSPREGRPHNCGGDGYRDQGHGGVCRHRV